MNEPRRLRESGTSPLERALLDAGTSYRSSRATRARTLAALGVAGSAALSAGAAAASSSSLLTKIGWVKLVSAISVAGAASASIGYYAWQRHAAGEPAAVVARGSNQALALTLPRIAPRVDPKLEPSATLEPAPATGTSVVVGERPDARTPNALSSRATTHAVRSSPASLRSSPEASGALLAELAAVDSARAALARGDAVGALSRLDAYARSYPRGRLELEAEVLRMAALARSGQAAAAKARAASFLRRHPNSVLGARVRGYLGD
jgi:hypothetical protein